MKTWYNKYNSHMINIMQCHTFYLYLSELRFVISISYHTKTYSSIQNFSIFSIILIILGIFCETIATFYHPTQMIIVMKMFYLCLTLGHFFFYEFELSTCKTKEGSVSLHCISSLINSEFPDCLQIRQFTNQHENIKQKLLNYLWKVQLNIFLRF